ncbi:MAG: NAD(P)H-dependent oxidoreductase [Pseudomonadota bacterium]
MSDAARTVLLVQSSARREGSITRRLAETLARRRAAALGLPLVVRDLGEGVELVDEAWVEANFTDADARSEAQRVRLAGSDALVAELKDAAEVIVAAPVYNFGAPASLKAWIDQVARARVTFRYTETGPEGLLTGKRGWIVGASGGTEIGGPIEFATGWLRHVLGFIGIHDVELIAADRVMMNDAAVAEAEAELDRLAPAA